MIKSMALSSVCFVILPLVAFVSSDQPQPPPGLDNVWISKIFSNSMWTFAVNSSLNSECTLQGRVYLEHLENNTHWAIRMLDSSVVAPSGLIGGADIQYGHADQCLQTEIPFPNFQPKYCLPSARFSPYPELYPEYYGKSLQDWSPYDMEENVWDFIRPRDSRIRNSRHSFRWGLCVPEVCTVQDIHMALNETLFQAFAEHQIQFEVNLTDVDCYSKVEMESKKLPLAGKGLLWFILVLVICSLTGTVLDYNTDYKSDIPQTADLDKNGPGKIKSFFLTLSFIRNTRYLCDMKNENQILVPDGWKGFAMMSAMIVHRSVYAFGYVTNIEYSEKVLREEYIISVIVNGLDIFFCLSGFLLAWNIIRNLKKKQTIKYWSIFLNRIFRFYPMYVILIAFVIWVLPYIGEGPLWKSFAEFESEMCRQHWWEGLLFISTLTGSGGKCIWTSWYLSTDFQLFLISLSLIYIVTKLSSWRKYILVVALIVAYSIPSIVLYFTRDSSVWFYSVEDSRNMRRIDGYFSRTYSRFYIRIPPYIAGVCAAYLIDFLIEKKFKVSKFHRYLVYPTVTAFHCVVCAVGGLVFYRPGHEYNVWEHVLYAVLYRMSSAAIVIATLVEVLCGGYKSWFTSFLSSPILVVLGRLSYHMFLLNLIIIPIDFSMKQSATYINFYLFLVQCAADLLIITLVAYFTTMIVEPAARNLRMKFLPR